MKKGCRRLRLSGRAVARRAGTPCLHFSRAASEKREAGAVTLTRSQFYKGNIRRLTAVFRLSFRRQTVQPAPAFLLRCGFGDALVSAAAARLSYRHGTKGAAFEKGDRREYRIPFHSSPHPKYPHRARLAGRDGYSDPPQLLAGRRRGVLRLPDGGAAGSSPAGNCPARPDGR
ncbi:DUF1472 domain-containing protein [Enterobacter kobei]|nr:DUF1472 domain-containing protein [Enterobacter kobei]QIP22482.1 DUF1472 domain-containing protein [Enterobacter kobei]